MQLAPERALVALALVSAVSLHGLPARADGDVTTRGSMEVGGYRDSLAVSVLTPSAGVSVESPTAGWGVNGRYLVDVVSAASPDIVSTASSRWVETRHAGAVGGKYKPGNTGVSAVGSASYTPDYLSLGASGQVTQDLDEKNLTLIAGYGYGHDTIGRTGTPFSVFSRTLEFHSATAGLTRVVNPRLVVSVTGDGIFERGDQSKPYRYIPIFAPGEAARILPGASVDEVAARRIHARPLEQLPLARDRFALTGRLAWRFQATTLRLDERGYADSWGLRASTTDLRYFVDVSERVSMWPHLRFHAQNSVAFWQRAYTSAGPGDIPALRTGDRELSALMNVGAGGGVRFALGRAGAVSDFVLTTTFDGTWSSFADTVYVKSRYSALAALGLEVVF
jgi:Protein of unknown function (DUF3570)